MKKYYIIFTLILLCCTINAQIINFPDPVLKSKLILQGFDLNSDGEITIAEANSPWATVDVHNSGITNLEGLQFFSQMIELYCQDNQITGTFDTSPWPYLRSINFANNLLTTVNLTGSSAIELNFSNNPITSFDMAPITEPSFPFNLYLNNTLITSLDLSNQPLLYEMNCTCDDPQNSLLTTVNLSNSGFANSELRVHNNKINSLQIDGMHANIFTCSFNELTTLDLSAAFVNQLACNDNHLTQLAGLRIGQFYTIGGVAQLQCQNNELEELDLSNCENHFHMIQNNPLKRIFMKNNYDDFDLFQYLPTLEYVCVDESEANYYDGYFEFGAPFAYNSYCSFVPGGTFYVISGDNHLDIDNNGCDASDPIYPNLKTGITNGSISGSVIADASGHYNIPVQAGSHTLTPVFENNYFTGTATTVNFPTDASPAIHDFCITSNGTHPDAEVLLIPQGAARPGFDAQYKLLYKNKGTTVQSGNVTLVHENTIAFVSATQSIANQTGNSVSWNFTNLMPFEQREIEVTMHVNTPTQTPPVNAGTVLSYIAAINTDLLDETPDDNNFFLHQTVVNSLDPNDKVCLEGTTIGADQVGGYVHYQIRFENTGTAEAVNIVVADLIDTTKFDLNSLVPIDGSHDFYTRINGNKVEFIFENINLPFDDANNDGYLVFKIKTKSTLVVGNSFSNSASIYFDYNHPIVTEPAVTTIAVLKTQDFAFADHFKLYPNPAHNEINLNRQSNLEIQSIEIYNALGQLMIAVTNAQSVLKIDVSKLTSGNYFVKVNSEQGSAVARFVKQ